MAAKNLRKSFLKLLDAIEKINDDFELNVNFERSDAIEFTIDESRTEFLCGEEGLAVELLISNLHELKFPLTGEIYQSISEISQKIGLPKENYIILETQIKGYK